MKRAILIIGVILMGLTLRAQSVTYSCRYWFDQSDAQVAITEFTGSLWEEELDVGMLNNGLHTLHLQVMDASTDWSAPESFLFLKLDATSDLEIQYWFDQDLEGKQVIAFSNMLLLDVDALDLGMHTLHILLKGTEYTSTESYLFLKADTPEQMESYTCHYWFDQDFDNALSTEFGDGNLLMDVTGLTDGIHSVHITLEGSTLTSTESYMFLKVPVEEVDTNTYRYWFDRDLDNSQTFVLTDGVMLLDVSALENGLHALHLMKEGSSNSSTESYMFVKIPVLDPEVGMQYHCWFDLDYNTVQTGSVGNGVFFLDVSPLTVGSHTLVLQYDDGNLYSPEYYTFYRDPMVTIVYDPEEGGTATGVLEEGICTLTAQPNQGFAFVNWTNVAGEVLSSAAVYSFELPEDATIVAHFVRISYTITVVANPEEGGTVEGEGIYIEGTTCTLSAMPNVGYSFINWTKGNEVVSDEPTISFEATEDATYVANFELNTYEILAIANPEEGGSVDGSGTYTYGTTCTLTAAPNVGYSFINWTKGNEVVSDDLTISFSVTEDAEYLANFELNTYEILATANPEEGGMVEGAGFYAYGATCTLTATPYENFIFVNWTEEGEVVSASDSYTFEVMDNRTLVANFEYVSPLETDYITDGMILYLDGILNTRDGHSTTTEVWEDLIGNNDVTVNGYSSYTWEDNHFIGLGREGYLNTGKTWQYFNSLNGDLTIEIVTYIDCDKTWPEYRGLIGWHVNSDGMHAQNDQGSNRMQTLGILPVEAADDQIATVTYTRFEGSYLNGVWGAELNSMPDGVNSSKIAVFGNSYSQWRGWNDSIYCIRMYNRTLTPEEIAYNHSVDIERFGAGFPSMYYVFANANPDEGGTVEGFGDYAAGSTCTLIATPNEGFEFLYWVDIEGEVVSYDMEYSFTVTGDAYYYAVFELGMYEVLAFAEPEEGGEVEGGGYYAYGDTCTLIAMPNEGYQFLYWLLYDDVVSTEPEYSFEVFENAELIAVFESSTEIFYIEAFANPEEGGSVSGSSYYFLHDYCYLVAMPNDGYVFVNWTKDGEVVSTEPEYVFEVLESGNYVANFVSSDTHWTVDPTLYPDNMSITGIIQIDGEEQFSETLELGAFCDGECRGTVMPVFLPNLERYFVYLTVYGLDGDVIEFRLFDHETNQEVDIDCESTLVFEMNAVIGDIIEPYVFNFVSAITQTTNFAAGWNWWSSYVELGDNGMELLENGLGSNGHTIKSQSDGYASYLEGFGWYGSLTSVNNESTYQIRANQACTIEITAAASHPSDYVLTLNHGWTWVGYPVSTSMSVADAFSGIVPQTGDMVKSQSNGYASYLDGFGWYGQLNTLTPGIGLMFKSNNATALTFSYPEGPVRNNLKANQTADNNYWRPNLTAYPDNMSVMAVVELDNVEVNSENYELAAFANGECRGSARLLYVEPLDRYFAFLTVAGDEATELYFGLYNTETGEEIVGADQTATFSVNAVLGSFAEPYVVSFRGTTGVDEWARSLQVYPNPVEPGLNITLGFDEVETGEVRVEIINAQGAVMEMRQATSLQTITAPNAAGVYTLRITVEGKGTCYRKLVVR